MNTPIERIQELFDKQLTMASPPESDRFCLDNKPHVNKAGYFYDGFKACEKMYSELWQKYIDQLTNNADMTVLTERQISEIVFKDFNIWLQREQNGDT